jgi:type IV pilus assembly protein PilE
MTVLELLIVLAVFALLLSWAVPTYQRYTLRAQRADAVRSLLAIAACQERLRARAGYYDTTACLDLPAGPHYRFRLAPPDETETLNFTALAEPLSPLAGDTCGTLSLDQAGTRAISGAAERLSDCWGGR